MRLLAHELVHVVQQTTSRPMSPHLQRAPDEKSKPVEDKPKPRQNKPKLPHQDKPKPGQDVIVLGEGWKGAEELGSVLSPGGKIISVKSVAKRLRNSPRSRIQSALSTSSHTPRPPAS